MTALCTPDSVEWCDGSQAEWDRLTSLLVEKGTFTRLNPEKRPNSFLARSTPSDVARVEDRTFICSKRPDRAGPTNHWADPAEMRAKLTEKFNGCMKGRTMYVIPFCMGPLDSPLAKIGIEITDSAYVVVNMRIMMPHGRARPQAPRRRGRRHRHQQARRLRQLHPLPPLGGRAAGTPARPMSPGPATTTNTSSISRKPARSCPLVPVTAATRCSARSASRCASPPTSPANTSGWPSTCSSSACENPEGEKTYLSVAFPSACGKTNLAMLIPPQAYQEAGWKTTIIGDDIAWLWPHEDGKLHAINPETGYFGVAPGTAYDTNPLAMESIKANTHLHQRRPHR